MVKNAWLKDTLREIKGSLNRFLSIFAIVALGVGFFVGVKATSPDMKLTADIYFKSTHLMDLHILSTLGFGQKDVDALKAQSGFSSVMPSYSVDALMEIDNSSVVAKVLALPDGTNSVGKTLNTPILLSGRFPERSGECVIEPDDPNKSYHYQIGDKIHLQPDVGDHELSDFLKQADYTIVGFINSPQYISVERGSSTVGDGSVDCFMMIPTEDFSLDVFTDVYLCASGVQELSAFSTGYQDVVNIQKKVLEDLELTQANVRYDEIMNKANNEISEAKIKIADAIKEKDEKLAQAQKDINDAKTKIADAEKEKDEKLAKAKKDIDNAKHKIDKAQADLDANKKKMETDLAKAEKDLEDGKVQYAQAKAEYDQKNAEFQVSKAKFEQAKAELASLKSQIDSLEAQIQAYSQTVPPDDPQLLQMQQQLTAMKQQYAQGQAEISAQQSQIDSAQSQLNATNAQLTKTKAQLDKSEKELETGKKDAQTQINDAQKKIDDSKRKLAAAEKEYEKGKEEAEDKIASAKADIAKAEQDYESGKADADKKIADAQAQIDDAEKDLADLDKPEWYIQTRDDNPGYAGYEENADRIDAIASVFPVFFLLVAGMVCLTTMTRMVEEQRTQIGTLKALGYSRTAIAGKYFAYAVLASITGGIAGITVGLHLFPTVIYGAYDMMYNLPPLVITFQWGYAIGSTLVAVFCTVAVALFACYNELVCVPAALMRPKAPKPGKRIFVEKIGPIWNHMGFISKVTARNLLRYKIRFIMTVLGIAGCAALMLAGFGLKNSISVIVPLQFDELYSYDLIIGLKDEISEEESAALRDDLSADSRISKAMLTRQKVLDAENGTEKVEIHLMVPQDSGALKNYVTLRHRLDKKTVSMDQTGVLISEKLSRMLNVSAGDTITLKDGDTRVQVQVSDILENYILHNIYMSPQLYARLFGTEPLFNSVIGIMQSDDETTEKTLATDWLEREDVVSVNFTTNVSDNFEDTIKSLNTVVLVMIVSAGCLAFVVLYNLTNINICERTKEIATIKVLGFYSNEVANYVYRENLVLTVLGILLGLGLGILLHQFVVVSAEVNIVMFGRNIEPLSYVYAAALTLLFTLFVNFVLYFRLNKINMVESLKSVE